MSQFRHVKRQGYGLDEHKTIHISPLLALAAQKGKSVKVPRRYG